MNVPILGLRQSFLAVFVALAALGCEGHPRVIGDGWHSGAQAQSRRAVRDSLLGLSAAGSNISYVGLTNVAARLTNASRATGELTGGEWGRALLALGPLSVVVGHPGSGSTNAAARLYAKAGVPLVAPNATAHAEPDVEAWIFRLLPDDAEQGTFLAEYALDSLRIERIAVVFVGDAYGVGILRGVRAALAKRGLPLADEVELPFGDCTMTSVSAPRLAARALVQRARPDAVIIALPLQPANCVIDELVRSRPTAELLGADALDDAFMDRWARTQVPNARLRIATGWVPRRDSATTRFVETFVRNNGIFPSGADALQYDALLVAATALRETNGSPRQVRDWLARLGDTRDPVEGLTGPISFAPGRQVRLSMRTVQ